MNTLKHVVVDGASGFYLGCLVDNIFEKIHTTETVDTVPQTTRALAMLMTKVAAQSFISIAVAVELNGFMYPGSVGDDPTNGFWMLWSMMEGSPHLRKDMGLLGGWFKTLLSRSMLGDADPTNTQKQGAGTNNDSNTSGTGNDTGSGHRH